MQNARQRIEQAFAGIRPDRTPIYDLICNDAVIEHFAGRKLDSDDAEAVVIAALSHILDGTRDMTTPKAPGTTWRDKAGNLIEAQRWTSWVKQPAHADEDEWAGFIRGDIERLESEPEPAPADIAAERARQQEWTERFNGTVYIHTTPSVSINEAMFGYHCGLDHFTYLRYDHPELIRRWLDAIEQSELRRIQRVAHADLSPLALLYSDVAFKTGLMMSRDDLRAIGFFDNVERLTAACHGRGLKVIFHSDGYVMDIMADLVAIGIDGFNPIEKAAGMDAWELRRRFPELTLVGGMDVTHFLPNGTPDEIRAETRRMIDELGADGRLLIGSTTELDNTVPLENYLAFHDEVMRG